MVNLKVDFRIEEAYVADMNQRLSIYRRIAAARSEDELTQAMADVRDRYGPLPLALLNLADYGRIRVLADALGVESVDREGAVVVFKFREKAKVDPTTLVRLVRERADLQLVPPSSLKLHLRKDVSADGRRQSDGSREAGDGGRQSDRSWRSAAAGSRPSVERRNRQPAWWTVRATAGEVTPGFSKAELTKVAPEDPRAPNGLLERVTGLLDDLRDS
jgi:TRCF domain